MGEMSKIFSKIFFAIFPRCDLFFGHSNGHGTVTVIPMRKVPVNSGLVIVVIVVIVILDRNTERGVYYSLSPPFPGLFPRRLLLLLSIGPT
jgi:hypothetical protein